MVMTSKNLLLTVILSLFATVIVEAADGTDASAELVGSFQIRNVRYGDLLRPKDASNAEGAAIVLYPAEPWKCMTWRVHQTTNSTYQVQNHFTLKTFTVKADAGEKQVTQVSWSRDSAQRPQWKFSKLSDGTYKITDAKTDEVLTAKQLGDLTGIVLAPWKDLPEQKWKLEAIDPVKLTM